MIFLRFLNFRPDANVEPPVPLIIYNFIYMTHKADKYPA